MSLLGGGTEEFVHDENQLIFFFAHGSAEINKNNLDCGKGTNLKIRQLRKPVMDKDKERWSTRWKTKNCLRNYALSAIFSLTFVLQATQVRAGKEKVEEHRH